MEEPTYGKRRDRQAFSLESGVCPGRSEALAVLLPACISSAQASRPQHAAKLQFIPPGRYLESPCSVLNAQCSIHSAEYTVLRGRSIHHPKTGDLDRWDK